MTTSTRFHHCIVVLAFLSVFHIQFIYAQPNFVPGTNITCKVQTTDKLQCNGTSFTETIAERDRGMELYIDLGIVAALVIVSGMMSGLTLGLLSLDTVNLEIIINAGDAKDSKNAKKILPLVKKHHLLLVTLLLANAAAMEALPIFLDRMVPTWVAILCSVTLVLLFGEIIPQSLCSRFGLSIGANLSYLVWAMIVVFFIISWPISKVLDFLLGEQHGTYFRRGELKELLKIHGHENHEHGILTVDETTIMKGALDMKDKTAENIMTPLEKVFMVEIDRQLDSELMQQISDSGKSRIPVYREIREHIIGVLLIKSLLPCLLTPVAPGTTVNDLTLTRLPTVSGTISLYDLLNHFQTGKSHLAIVVNPLDHMTVMGIVTLEDVIEELIQEEIYDEADFTLHQKILQKAKQRATARSPASAKVNSSMSTSVPSSSSITSRTPTERDSLVKSVNFQNRPPV